MLHILWMILKFILIALGSIIGLILGLILLLILLVLFCPFRYEADVEKSSDSFKEIRAGGGVSWLFYLISIKVWYENGKMDKSIRLFGIPVLKVLDWLKKRKENKKSTEETIASIDSSSKDSEIEKSDSQNDSVTVVQENVQKKETESPPAEDIREETKAEEVQDLKKEETPEKTSTVSETEEDFKSDINSKETTSEEKRNKKKKRELKKQSKEKVSEEQELLNTAKEETSSNKTNKIQEIKEKIKAIPEKIRSALQNAEEKKNKLIAKLEWWKSFLGHEKTKAAVRLVKKSLIRMLKHILPTKVTGNLSFGLDDPALMGKILAVSAMTIPFHKNAIKLDPVFDEGFIIQGKIRMKGRIYVIVFVWNAVRMLVSRNIWFVIKHWKNKEEK